MSRVAVLGGGAGGAAACVELVQRGHDVTFWSRSEATLAPFERAVGVPHRGALGEGVARPALITSRLDRVLDGADVAVVCLPAVAHGVLFADLVRMRWLGPIVLNPGHTGGALHLRAAYGGAGMDAAPPVAELSTLTYVARRAADGVVNITGVASRVGGAALAGRTTALDLARELFPCVEPVENVLATSLSNVNLVLHPPGAILAAAWVEATGGEFTFYVEAMTPGTVRMIEALDAERRAVARAFGHDLPSLAQEMAVVGTADAAAAARNDTRAALVAEGPNSALLAPESLRHRYYVEDFAYGLVPFRALAAIAEVSTPVADALTQLGAVLTGQDFAQNGLTAEKLGIAGMSRSQVLALVRGTPVGSAAA